MATLDTTNRGPRVEILPDLRKRVTRRYDISNPKATMGDTTMFDANVEIPWGTADVDYESCLLVSQSVVGQNDNSEKSPNSPYTFLIRVFEEIDRNGRTLVGNPNISYDQYGRKTAVLDYLQYSDGTTPYTDTVGTTAAPVPNAACILKTVESTNDGTLIRTKLTFIDAGTLSDNEELRFNGLVVIRTITALNEPIATPSGYTLVTESTEYVDGLPVYRNSYAQASDGGGVGTGGVISQGFVDQQNGSTAFNPASPNSSVGAVVCTTRYVSTPAITSNPITQPTGFVLFALEEEEDTGYKLWTSRSGFGSGIVDTDVETKEFGELVIYRRTEFNASGAYTPTTPTATIGGTVTLISQDIKNADGFFVYQSVWAEGYGLIVDETTTQATGALVIYHRVSLGVAPTTPSATIGGTVTLFESSLTNQDGYQRYDYRWAEGDGQSAINTQGEPDGAIVVQLTTLTAAASTPTSPGITYYLTSLTQTQENGYFRNTAVYKKPPATITLNKKISFSKPGNVTISGSPPQLVFVAPVTMDLLTSVEVSYATTQLSDTPFSVSAYATFYETYTPTDTGLQVSSTKSLGGYLAGASGTSGTNSVYNGILCDEWEYQLGASTPSSFSTGAKVLDVDNDPYLVATDGTVVYRRTKVSYTF